MVRKREKSERIILRCQADRPTHTHSETENLKHLERSQKMTGRVMKRKTAAEDGEEHKKQKTLVYSPTTVFLPIV